MTDMFNSSCIHNMETHTQYTNFLLSQDKYPLDSLSNNWVYLNLQMVYLYLDHTLYKVPDQDYIQDMDLNMVYRCSLLHCRNLLDIKPNNLSYKEKKLDYL